MKMATLPVQLTAVDEEGKLIPPQQRVDKEAKAWANIYATHEEKIRRVPRQD